MNVQVPTFSDPMQAPQAYSFELFVKLQSQVVKVIEPKSEHPTHLFAPVVTAQRRKDADDAIEQEAPCWGTPGRDGSTHGEPS